MTTPPSKDLIAAANDPDLVARLVAIGEALGYSQAQFEGALRRLAAADANDRGVGDTIARLMAYAAGQRENALKAVPPTAGANTEIVTDDAIAYALNKVLGGGGGQPTG